MNEYSSDPRGHCVGLRRSEMHVQDDDCHTDTEKQNNSSKYLHILWLFDDMSNDKASSRTDIMKEFALGKMSYLKVSKIIVNKTNFPSKGTTSDVGGMISASRRKNTVNDKRMLMDKLT